MATATKELTTTPLDIIHQGQLPLAEVYILRCGGDQAAVTWDALQDQLKPGRDAPLLMIVWDDGEKNLHPAIQHLPRVYNKKECVEYLLEQQGKKLHGAGSTKLRVNTFLCHGDAKMRQILHKNILLSFDQLREKNFTFIFPNIIHPTAFVSKTSTLFESEGVFVGPHAVVHTSACVGNFSLVNTAAVVEHDCILSEYTNVNPGAVLCGMVTVGTFTTIGANACIRDHVEVANETSIGMQAGVVADVTNKGTVQLGVPAQSMTIIKKNVPNHTANAVLKVESQLRDLRWMPKKRFDMANFEQYLRPSITKGHLTNDGPLQRVLMEKLRLLCHVSKRHILLTANGTSALHALVTAWEMKIGKRLIFATQSFTFPSSIQGPFSNAVVLDMDPVFGGPSIKQLDEVADKIDGVVVTNLFGLQAHVLKYETWCQENKKVLLFDNAATPIGFVDDKSCNERRSIHEVGDGAIISLHETKPIGRGEGGAVICPENLQRYVHRAMNFGFDVYATDARIPHRFASNWRMSDIAAAAVCDHIDHVIEDKWEDRMTQKARYAEQRIKLEGYSMLQKLCFPTILSCLLIALPEGKKYNLNLVCSYLHRSVPSIEAKRYYRPLGSQKITPLAWEMFDQCICLPFHIEMEKEMIDYQIKQLTIALSYFGSIETKHINKEST